MRFKRLLTKKPAWAKTKDVPKQSLIYNLRQSVKTFNMKGK
jgi:hypothetical protein